jgi:hypothetical protein
MIYYTYAYLREDGSPYYIGKGKNNRAYNYHGKFVKVPSKEKILILKNNLTEEAAFKHEIYMIAVFGRKDLGTGILINRTSGGDQPPSSKGLKRSEETRKKLSKASLGKPKKYNVWNKGKCWSSEIKDKISKSKKGKIVDKIYTEERSKKISDSKSIQEYELINFQGHKIITKNLSRFAKENKLTASALYAVLNKKRKHHKGWTVTKLED